VIRYLGVGEVLEIHGQVMLASGGAAGIHSLGALESAVAQPRMTFDGQELYPTMAEKACALGFSLIQNHPFVDGNKRTGHAALETFLVLNGYEINAAEDDQFTVVLGVAASEIGREAFLLWLQAHINPITLPLNPASS
jgi:death-on-curing protein